MQKNIKIRKALSDANMKHWQLADLLGVSEGRLSVKLRHELPHEEQEKILTIIRESKEGV